MCALGRRVIILPINQRSENEGVHEEDKISASKVCGCIILTNLESLQKSGDGIVTMMILKIFTICAWQPAHCTAGNLWQLFPKEEIVNPGRE
jgi:hypothetical protein